MSEAPRTLKEQNAMTIRLFVGGVALLFIATHAWPDLRGASVTLSALPAALDPARLSVSALGGIFSLLLLNLLPTRVKEVLVHWRLWDVLPGHRAFSQIGPRDARVDMKSIAAARGELPVKPADQNRLWYRLYREHEGSPGVRDAHKSYLLYRELATVSFLLLLLLVPASAFLLRASRDVQVLFAALLGGVYFLAAINAKNSGVRFVGNVLAAASAAPHQRDGSA
jgi:hypothetical protein